MYFLMYFYVFLCLMATEASTSKIDMGPKLPPESPVFSQIPTIRCFPILI
jgi:hypothetical protein